MNLYQVTQRHQQIEAMLEESEGELTPEIEALLLSTKQDFEEFAESQIKFIQKLESQIEAVNAEIKRLEGLKKWRKKSIDLLENNFLVALQMFGKKDKNGVFRYNTDTLRISTRKSEVLKVLDLSKIPAGFFSVSRPTLQMDAVKRAIKQGFEIEGAIIEEKHHLAIK